MGSVPIQTVLSRFRRVAREANKQDKLCEENLAKRLNDLNVSVHFSAKRLQLGSNMNVANPSSEDTTVMRR